MHFFTDNSFHPAGDFQVSLVNRNGTLIFNEELKKDINFVVTLSRVDEGPVRLATRVLFNVSTTGFPVTVSGELIQNSGCIFSS